MGPDTPATAPEPAFRSPAELQQMLLGQTQEHAIVILDVVGNILVWTGASEKILGYNEQEMLGQPISRIFEEVDQDRGLPLLEREVAAADGRSEDDRWHVRKDDTRIWISGTITPIRGEQGQLIGYGKIMRDRTDLRSQIETLENRVESLSRSQGEKDGYFAKLAHEIRNSLSPLTTVVDIFETVVDATARVHAMTIARRQLALLTRLAEDTAELARLSGGKLALSPARLELGQTLRGIVEVLRPRAERKQQLLQLLAPPASLDIQADPERLHQIVFNLLDNAIKYTPAQGRIWLKLTVEGPHALIRVEDTGIGIDSDLMPRIFDMFVQAEQSSAEGGFGIGLSLVRDLVHAHGGTIEVRSPGVNQGTEFSVRLPLQLDAMSATAPGKSPE